ncbi:MAG TPA: hybrid sensor histidine kinase/response regulator, partial [Amaricoccus sp.]|nr:hybrid sensor histidine kinase/response regulator [Amaricoccus sp.]
GAAPDVVLTDYRLDGEETGVEVIEALRRDLGAPLPALIVSAERAASVRRSAGPLGVPVLEKPVAEGDLRRLFRRLLEGPA